MIEVKFDFDDKKGTVSLTVSGHAGQAEEGKDIVCAAVSVLAYTVAQIVSNIDTSGGLKKPPLVELSKGDARIVCTPKSDRRKEIVHTYMVAQVGYHLLEHNYPQYVKLNRFGEALQK